MSVNVPHNPEQKEADIQRKLQIYGIYKGMDDFILPSYRYILMYVGIRFTNIKFRVAFQAGKAPSVSTLFIIAMFVYAIANFSCAEWANRYYSQ